MSFRFLDKTLFRSAAMLMLALVVLCAQAGDMPGAAASKPEGKLHVLIERGRVEAAPGEVDRETTSSAHSVIEAERFRDRYTRLADVLEQEVGLQTRSSGGAGGYATMTLRGSGGDQVRVYLDGVELSDATGSPVDLSLIALDTIERIEVYRGSTPLELGQASIGGAINLITRRHAGTVPGVAGQRRFSASIASFHTVKLDLAADWASARDALLVSGGYLQSRNDFTFVNDNGTRFNAADDRVERRHNDAIEQLALLGNWQHRFDDHYRGRLRLDVLRRDKEIPGVNNDPRLQTTLDTRQFDLLGQWSGRDVGKASLDFDIKSFFNRKREVFDDRLNQPGFIDQHTDSVDEKFGAQLFVQLPLAQMKWKGLLGVSAETYRQQRLNARLDSGTNRRRAWNLAIENIRFFFDEALTVSLALRYQFLRDRLPATGDAFGVILPAATKHYTLLTPQAGIKYRFNRRHFLTANLGRYHRAPTFLELFGGDGLLQGNTRLRPERSLNFDAGYQYSHFQPYHWLHDATVYLGVFHNRIDDLIVRIYNGQGVGVPLNISAAVVQGIEASLGLTPTEHQRLDINFTWTDSINQSQVTSFNGRRLPGFYQASLGLRYARHYQDWRFGLEADLKRGMYYDRSNLLEGDEVNLLKIWLQHDIGKARLDFRIDNLLDESIRYFRNRPTPGRAFSFTLTRPF